MRRIAKKGEVSSSKGGATSPVFNRVQDDRFINERLEMWLDKE